jgi:hypothetical protein
MASWTRVAIASTGLVAGATTYLVGRKARTFLDNFLRDLNDLAVQEKEVERIAEEREQQLLTDEEYPLLLRVATEVVARFGGRPKTNAELRAARIMAYRLMREADHRIKHCERDLPEVMTLIVTPTQAEARVEKLVLTGRFVQRLDRQELHLASSVRRGLGGGCLMM